jgi:malonate transporter and related proteins
VALVVGLKLLIMPVIAWVLATQILGLPALGTNTVVLLAACPTGANAFLFASRFERAVGPVSGGVAVGTALAAATISLTLLLLSSR